MGSSFYKDPIVLPPNRMRQMSVRLTVTSGNSNDSGQGE